MKKSYLWNILILAFLVGQSSVFGEKSYEDNVYTIDDNALYDTKQGLSAEKATQNKVYNSPAQIKTKGICNMYLTGAFLYWNVSQEGLEFAKTSTKSTATNPLFGGQFKTPHFHYRPGLKVGFGVLFSHDNWEIYANWTHALGRGNHDSYAPSGGVLYPIRVKTAQQAGTTATTASFASACSRINYNTLDLAVGRPYYVGANLIFQPFYGLRGAWIKEKFNITYNSVSLGETDIGNFYIRNVFRSWGLGLRGGLNSHWLLSSGVFFFGNANLSLLFSQAKGRAVESNASYASTIGREYLDVYNARQKKNNILNPNLDLLAGFGWGSYFYKNNAYFSITAAYECNHWFDYLDLLMEYKGNLNLHGLTLKMRFDY